VLNLIFSIFTDDRIYQENTDTLDLFIVFKKQTIINSHSTLTNYQKIILFKNINYSYENDFISKLTKRIKIYEVDSFWSINAIRIKVARNDFNVLLNYGSEIERIYLNKNNFRIHKNSENYINNTVWNIYRIKADSVWLLYDIGGRNVVIGHIDTGIDDNHPALYGKVVREYWKDLINNVNTPYDDNGHGTHTAGIIAGGDGIGPFSPDIGVAPYSKIISCKAFDKYGTATFRDVINCIEYFAELKIYKNVNIRIASNSWGDGHGNTELWIPILNAWRNNDIIPIFAIGNSFCSSYQSTTSSPGDYPIVIGVGSTNILDQLSTFSSCGPAPNTYPFNDFAYWPRSDWNYIKPDLVAPGEGILSSVPNGYAVYSGTSMATPHVAGVIALMLEKNPYLDFYQIYYILTNYGTIQPENCSAYRLYPNNECGWGRVDAKLAVDAVNDSRELSFEIRIKGNVLVILSLNSERSKIKLYNSNGSIIFDKVFILKKGANIIYLPKKKGIYVLIVETSSIKIKKKILIF